MTADPTEARVPQSMDVGAQEALMDVERFFPSAMAHLKSHHAAPSALADDREARRWHEVTHTVNVDGYRPVERGTAEDEAARAPSFFDEGSLDIRGGLRDVAPSSSAATAPHARAVPPPSRAERLSPDVLQLTGGVPRQHGAALARESNAAPADQTLEVEDGNYMGRRGDQASPFGDTPVQLTDMLRERLMELKGERLREERTDAFLPRRLPLKSDAQIARERQQQQQQQQHHHHHQSTADRWPTDPVPRLAAAAVAGGVRAAAPPSRRPATLADLADEGEADTAAPAPAIVRDGVSADHRARAAGVLRHVYDYPASGGGPIDALSDVSQPLDRPATPHRRGGVSSHEDGSVYLLRVLPRTSLCSRREAAAMVASGQVRVNNVVERNPFRLVRPEDDVHVAGHASRLRFAPPRLWMYHKPANVIVSRNDVAGRTLIGKHARILGMDHLVPVGSLPMRAHGILLLTNDGELSRYLENPKANIQQTYLLRVRPAIDPVLAHKLNTEGININGRQYRGAMEFMVNPAAKSRYSLKVKVRGETLPIAHLMQHLGRKIERGGRVSFGPFSLSTLPVGSVREVAIPAFYADHLGAVWRPFVERDWPYFRRQRVHRLRHLAKYRELNPRELAELDDFTYAEVQDALRFDAQEHDTARAELLQRPSFFTGRAIPNDFPVTGRRADHEQDIATMEGTDWADATGHDDEGIVEDITSIV